MRLVMNINILTSIKTHLSYMYITLQSQLNGDRTMAGLTIILGSILQFITQNAAIDIVLVFLLCFTIILNTIIGVYKAKKFDGTYSQTILKESIIGKVVGYFLVLVLVSIFMIILFVVSKHQGIKFEGVHWLNLPVVLCLVFFASMEVSSSLDNLSKMGVIIPLFVKNLPDKVKNKIEKLGDDSKL